MNQLSQTPSAQAAGPVPTAPQMPLPPQKNHYDVADARFAILAFVLGYAFLWLVGLVTLGAGVTLFALCYAGCVLAYAAACGVKPTRASWGWLAFLLAMAALFFVGIPALLTLPALFFLAAIAVYWAMAVFGARTTGRLDAAVLRDGWRGFFELPFGSFGALPGALGAAAARRAAIGPQKKRRSTAGVWAGIALTVLLLPVVVMLLAGADDAFATLLQTLALRLKFDFSPLVTRLIFAVPVSFYLFGLFYGARHKKGVPAQGSKAAAKKLSFAALGIPAAALVAVYLLFFVNQLPYFISAFWGRLPATGGMTYAQYARGGFFELLWVAVINLALLGFGKAFVARGGTIRRAVSVLLCLATALMVAIASSKMALYISAYGTTRKRVWASWAMVLVAVCIVLFLLDEFKQFSLMRVLALCFCGWFFVLCAVNTDALILQANYTAWQAGTIENVGWDDGEASMKATVLRRIAADPNTPQEVQKQALWELQVAGQQAEYQNSSNDLPFTGFTLRGALAQAAAESAQ